MYASVILTKLIHVRVLPCPAATEVFIFSTLIGYFLLYLTLSAVTTWTQQGQLLCPL